MRSGQDVGSTAVDCSQAEADASPAADIHCGGHQAVASRRERAELLNSLWETSVKHLGEDALKKALCDSIANSEAKEDTRRLKVTVSTTTSFGTGELRADGSARKLVSIASSTRDLRELHDTESARSTSPGWPSTSLCATTSSSTSPQGRVVWMGAEAPRISTRARCGRQPGQCASRSATSCRRSSSRAQRRAIEMQQREALAKEAALRARLKGVPAPHFRHYTRPAEPPRVLRIPVNQPRNKREAQAATRIQAWLRGVWARAFAARMKRRARVRLQQKRREAAATRIQSQIRARVARREAKARRQQKIERERIERERHAAASKIQARSRGMVGRREAARKREQAAERADQAKHAAASKIQARCRGRAARKDVAARREQAAAKAKLEQARTLEAETSWRAASPDDGERRISQWSGSDEVSKTELSAYSFDLAQRLSRGHRSVLDAILAFFRQNKPSHGRAVKSAFLPFDCRPKRSCWPASGCEVERIMIDISLRDMGGSVEVACTSRCTTISRDDEDSTFCADLQPPGTPTSARGGDTPAAYATLSVASLPDLPPMETWMIPESASQAEPPIERPSPEWGFGSSARGSAPALLGARSQRFSRSFPPLAMHRKTVQHVQACAAPAASGPLLRGTSSLVGAPSAAHSAGVLDAATTLPHMPERATLFHAHGFSKSRSNSGSSTDVRLANNAAEPMPSADSATKPETGQGSPDAVVAQFGKTLEETLQAAMVKLQDQLGEQLEGLVAQRFRGLEERYLSKGHTARQTSTQLHGDMQHNIESSNAEPPSAQSADTRFVRRMLRTKLSETLASGDLERAIFQEKRKKAHEVSAERAPEVVLFVVGDVW